MAAYQITDGGVLRERDSAFIPNDPANRDWQEYLAWVGAGNTADPAPTPTLAEEKASAVKTIERQFTSRVNTMDPPLRPLSVAEVLLIREVDTVETDGSPSAGDYPMLAAMVPDVGADVGAVGTVLRAEFDANSTALAGLEAARRAGVTAVNAAADSAAVAAALAAVAWP